MSCKQRSLALRPPSAEQLHNRIVSHFPPHEVAEALDKVRAACLALPETSERLSHGGPAFFIRNKKCFVMFLDDHHGDGRLAIWCAAPDGVQADLVDTDPERRPTSVRWAGSVFSCQKSRMGSSAQSVKKRLRLSRRRACSRCGVPSLERD